METKIKIRIDIDVDQALRLSQILLNSIDDNEKIARSFEKDGNKERADFFKMVVAEEIMLKGEIDHQIQDPDNFHFVKA